MVACTQLPAPVATLTGNKTKTKTMWNPSRNVRWRRDSSGVMRRMDVRRDTDGNVDQHFYAAWDTAVYETSAEANINNDLLSAWTEADIWNQLEEDRLNGGAVASQRKSNIRNPRTTASSTGRISTAVDDESDQDYAVLAAPTEAPRSKRRRVDSRPSSTTLVVDRQQRRDAAARRSVFDRIHDQSPQPQQNGWGSRNNTQYVAPSGDVGWGRRPQIGAQPTAVAQPKAITQLEILKQIQAINKQRK